MDKGDLYYIYIYIYYIYIFYIIYYIIYNIYYITLYIIYTYYIYYIYIYIYYNYIHVIYIYIYIYIYIHIYIYICACVYNISIYMWSRTNKSTNAQTSLKQDERNIYAIMKTMCPSGYTQLLCSNWCNSNYVPKCMSCHKDFMGITRRAHCFHDCLYMYI